MADGWTVRPVGVVRSALTDLACAPRQPDEDAPPARLVFDDAVAPALDGIRPGARVVVLTWLDRADLTTPRAGRTGPTRSACTP